MELRIFTEPQQGASHASLVNVATAARDNGFGAFFRSDHLLVMGSGQGLLGPSESMLSLGAIAAQVPGIRLGTLVTSATFRHPAMLAIAAANVDDISGGRLELGMGAGWFEAEHTAYGIPFGTSFGERFDRLTEQLEILTGLWATPVGGSFDHSGAHYTLRGAPGLPKPVQRASDGTPKIPLIIGGRGPKRTPALAARFADEYNCGFTDPDATAAQFGRVRSACAATGRNPDELVYSSAKVLCVGEDAADVAHRASAIGRDVDDLVANDLAGTPDQVIGTLRRFATAGVQRMYLQVLDLTDVEHIVLAGTRILPAVTDL